MDIDGCLSGSDSIEGAGGRGIEENVPTKAPIQLLRKEIELAESDAKAPYVCAAHVCRLFPIRTFDRRNRLMAHIEKDNRAPNGVGLPSSRAIRLIIALFSREQILTASGSPHRRRRQTAVAHKDIEIDCRFLGSTSRNSLRRIPVRGNYAD